MISSSTSRLCSTALIGVVIAVAIGGAVSVLADGPVIAGGPFVYTHWETFYAEEGGLPNDHIFAITADGERLWVGTEDGLALYENGKWRSWREKDGLPWRVVSAIAVSEELTPGPKPWGVDVRTAACKKQ